LAAYFVDKAFKDISRAYEAIRPEVAAEFLGLEYTMKGVLGENTKEHIPALVESLTERGWNWDPDEGLLRPKVPPTPQEITQPTATGMGDLLNLIGKYGE
jgi:COP9 signalosome complex subunit 8